MTTTTRVPVWSRFFAWVQNLLPRNRLARRVLVSVVGGTVVLIGIALIVLPGPAVVVIPVGLSILALEFAWARRLLRRVKNKLQKMRRRRQDDAITEQGPAA